MNFKYFLFSILKVFTFKTTISKKQIFAVSFVALFLYSAMIVFAIPPLSPYTVGDNITDPSCAPNATNCYVTTSSGSGVVFGDPATGFTPDFIQYVDNSGNQFGDNLFTRDSTTKESIFSRQFTITAPSGGYDITTGAVVLPGTVSGTLTVGETLQFSNVNTSVVTFTGSGLDDLNTPSGSYTGSSLPDTYHFEITYVGAQLFTVSGPSGTFLVGETINDTTSGATGTVVYVNVPFGEIAIDVISGTFANGDSIVGATSGATGGVSKGSFEDIAQYSNDTQSITVPTKGGGTLDGINAQTNAPSGHTVGDYWEWTYTLTSTGTAEVVHQNLGVTGFIFVNNVTGSPAVGNSFVGLTSGEIGTVNFFGNSTFSVSDTVYAFDSSFAPSGPSTITANPSANTYSATGSALLDQWTLIVDDPMSHTKIAGVFTSTPSGPSLQTITSGYITNDDIFDGFFPEPIPGSALKQTDELGNLAVLGVFDASNIDGLPISAGWIIANGSANINAMLNNYQSGSWEIVSATGDYSKIQITPTSSYMATRLNDGSGDVGIGSNGSRVYYKFDNKTVQFPVNGSPSVGDVMTIDDITGDVITLGFDTPISGSSPITIGTTGNTLYSSGLTGTTDGGSGGYNLILGVDAGYGVSGVYSVNWLGRRAGYNATSAPSSNFFGENAGNGATSAYESNFIGYAAGNSATNAAHSNFLGTGAGMNATDARDSNFFGVYSGMNATNAEYSNFMGRGSGTGATDANNSNFFGYTAGADATNAFNSNFMGVGAGYGASGANNSNFFGLEAGQSATGAYDSTFIGKQAGKGATNAFLSIFMGDNAGTNATGANQSNFFGNGAGYGATSAQYSNFIGNAAGLNAANAQASNFFGYSAGNGATDAYDANFFGQNAGQDANNAHSSNFIGFSAGNGANNAQYSNFFGSNAGFGADDANNSNFSGQNAGMYAPNANNSNFYGLQAGYYATNANNSNFIGTSAGREATDAAYSTFIGENAGYQAATAADAVFIGTRAGYQATDAWRAVFTGYYAGAGATNAHGSVFSGYSAGQNATDAPYSVFLGTNAGSGATNAADAVFLGISAGQNATDAVSSVFLGKEAGSGATLASDGIFLGRSAGKNATQASYSVFLGSGSGQSATDADSSNFIGVNAGFQATYASHSTFLGNNAGQQATNAANAFFAGNQAGEYATDAAQSNFIGQSAGYNATSASNSNFFGQQAGQNATNANRSVFIGQSAGISATNAANAIFIGRASGVSDTVNNTSDTNDYSILLGQFTSTGGFKNSIAIGSNAANTASNQFMIGSSARPIDTTVWKGSAGTTCTLTTGTGVACSSDERLKTNITDLTTDTLEKLLNLKTVKYNWLQNPTSATQIGFLAQDLEQYFPELVATDSTGYKSVYYSQMTPVLVEAIREMNMKILDLNDLTKENTWRDALVAWFSSSTNGIEKIFTKEVQTDKLCVGQTCVTESQLQQLLQTQNVQNTPQPASPTSNPTPDPLTCTAPQVLNQTADACVDPVIETPPADEPPADTAPTE